MKKTAVVMACLALVGIASAAVIEYNFEDDSKIVDGAYGTASDSYTGADTNTATGVAAGAFTLTDSRNQGTIGAANNTAESTGDSAWGSQRAGVSAEATDWSTGDQSQTMSFSVDIAAGADVDLKTISFMHGYFASTTGNTTLDWYLQVVEGANTYNYSGDGWTHDGGVNYQDESGGLSTVTLDSALSGLSDTTVTFTWGFDGSKGHNRTVQSNWIDDVSLTVIPEPATLGMVVASGVGIFFIRRRLMM